MANQRRAARVRDLFCRKSAGRLRYFGARPSTKQSLLAVQHFNLCSVGKWTQRIRRLPSLSSCVAPIFRLDTPKAGCDGAKRAHAAFAVGLGLFEGDVEHVGLEESMPCQETLTQLDANYERAPSVAKSSSQDCDREMQVRTLSLREAALSTHEQKGHLLDVTQASGPHQLVATLPEISCAC